MQPAWSNSNARNSFNRHEQLQSPGTTSIARNRFNRHEPLQSPRTAFGAVTVRERNDQSSQRKTPKFRTQLQMTYFITFSCYGARLHGNDTGSVDRSHNAYGTRVLEPNQARTRSAQGRMIQTPYVLDPPQRSLVLSCLRDVCTYRNWNLLAAHVRTNHVHVVVSAAEKPESVMNTLKAYASRRLNESGLETSDQRRWSRHGSTQYLWNRGQVQDAVFYVVDGQGNAMSLYVNQELCR